MARPTALNVDPRQISVPAAVLAIAAEGTALVLLSALHVLSPEFSPAWRMISEYANGKYQWVLTLMFAAYGLSTLSLAFAIRSQVRARGAKIGLAALVISGIGAVGGGAFDLNQVAPHELAGILGLFVLPVGAVLISRTLGATPEWASVRRLLLAAAHLTWITLILWLASFPLMMLTFIHVQGALPSAPPRELPDGVIGFVGWTNRLSVLSAWAWVTIVAWNAIRIRRGASRSTLRGPIPSHGVDAGTATVD